MTDALTWGTKKKKQKISTVLMGLWGDGGFNERSGGKSFIWSRVYNTDDIYH